MKTYRAIDSWMFGWGSPVSLGVLRIIVGFLAIVNQSFLAWQYRDWFTETGLTPRWISVLWLGKYPKVGDIEVPRINLMNGITDPRLALAFLVGTVVLSFMFMLGTWTKATSILLALGILSVQHRSPAILHGGDTVIRILVMYLAFSPCGLACSVDRVVGLWRGKILPGPVVAPLWTQRVIQLNLAILYLTSVWTKWGGYSWKGGVATWYPNRLGEFERFWIPDFLRQYPMVPILTYGTLFVEFAMVSLVFYRPYRKWILGMAAGMHLFIEYSMNIPLFSWLMISMYICFYEGEEVSGWAKRIGEKLKRWRTSAQVPTADPGKLAAINAVDPFDLVSVSRGELSPSKAIHAAALRSIGAWWVTWIPGVTRRLLK